VRSNWSSRLSIPIVGAATIIAAALAAATVAARPPAATGVCPPALSHGEALGGGGPGAVAVDAVVGSRGEQTGRRLSVQPRRGPRVVVDLAPDSFVGPPAGGWLIYGEHRPATGSEVRALSLDNGCSVRIAIPDGIVRGALADAAGRYLYVHTVTSAGRRDGGVVRTDIATGETSAAPAPFEPDDDFGPIFATSLAWAHGGRSLVVQSCGYLACLTRVLDVTDSRLRTYDAPHGELVGVSERALIAFAAEHHRPTELLAVDLASGAVVTIADQVLAAEMAGTGSSTVRIETPAGWQEVMP
jgi:hypothetical protein